MITLATADHIQAMAKLGADYYAQSRFSQYAEYNETQAYEYIKNAIINPLCYVDVLVVDSQVQGFTIAHAGPQAWSSNLACNVAFIYIAPEHRTGGWETVFVERIEAWAQEHKMDEIIIGDYAMQPDRTQKLTEHWGYNTVGYIGVKRV